MDIDFLIIGQGLAGSLLAWELIQRNCKVIVIDNGLGNASKIAAGLINPITGQRFAKSYQVDLFLPVAKAAYAELSEYFQCDFYREKPMLRIFRSDEELKNCKKRLDQTAYENYLGKLAEPRNQLNAIRTPYGFLEQKQCGHLSTRLLLKCLKEFFIARNCYRHCEFDYQAIQLNPALRWRDISTRQLVFCEGYQSFQNPWFSRLPLHKIKGEILTLQHAADLPDKILNYGHWSIPITKDQIRMGASFERDFDSIAITDQAREVILKSFQVLAPSVQLNLIDQQVGIRPCTLDHQPFIGKHPQYPQIAIFNGFGAKGSLQIPWYAQHFSDYLLNSAPLVQTCNIVRYAESFTG